MSYTELSIEERATIQVGQYQKLSQREIARILGRSPSTISRELRRNRSLGAGYAAHSAQACTRERRKVCRPVKKLVMGNERFELVSHLLRERFSPEQIAGKLRAMKINFEEAYVCRETIYNAIYALPVGQLRKELIQCLRQGKSTRRPRSGGVDRRGQIPEMVSIHVRPPEIEDRLMPGHWDQGQGQWVGYRNPCQAHKWLSDSGQNDRRHRDFCRSGVQCCAEQHAAGGA